ncbi:MAG: hypothetical protein ABEJ79_03050 [Halolamina sp.]
MDAPLRAGVAAYDAGEYRAAARCWRRAATTAETAADGRVVEALATLARATAVATTDGADADATDATSLPTPEGPTDPEAALSSLASVGGTHRGVDLDAARDLLQRLADDSVDGAAPRLRCDGRRLRPGDLSPEALGVAAEAVATVRSARDDEPGANAATDGPRIGDPAADDAAAFERVVADAARFAREAEGPGRSTFGALLVDYVADRERAMVCRRLRQHVARERRKDRDVDGLFE